MKIIKVKCESCGAALKIDDESSVFTCEYCGTSLKLVRNETPPPPNPSAGQAPANNFNFQFPKYCTQIVADIKTNIKKAARFARPIWIISFIAIFVIIVLSIVIPVVAVNSRNQTTFGSNGSNSSSNSGNSSGSQLPSNPMEPIVYNGTGDKVVGGIKLSKGNYYTKLTHDGSHNLIVKFFYGSGQTDYVLIANKIGVYTGYSLLGDVLGVAVTDGTIDIKADGNWTITIYEISETSEKSVSGKGDYVTGVIGDISGRKTVKMTHDGSRNFIVKIYTYNGGRTGYSLAANKIGNYSGETSVSFKSGSYYFISIQADGDWTVSIG